jgi:hypothetical protein
MESFLIRRFLASLAPLHEFFCVKRLLKARTILPLLLGWKSYTPFSDVIHLSHGSVILDLYNSPSTTA